MTLDDSSSQPPRGNDSRQSGFPERWVEPLGALVPRLHAWAHLRVRTQPRIEADDLVQEILVRVVERIATFHGEHFAPWVFQVAKHVLLESLRRSRRLARLQLGDGHSSQFRRMADVPASITTMTRMVATREDVRAFLAETDSLDDLDRQILVLCGLEDLRIADVAEQVGMGEEAVAKRWYRLRQRLRRSSLQLLQAR